MKVKIKFICAILLSCTMFLTSCSCSEPIYEETSIDNSTIQEIIIPPPVITLIGDEFKCVVNETEVPLMTKCYTHNGHVFFPVVDVMPSLGYSIGWDSNLSAVTLLKDGVVSYMFPWSNNIWVGPTEYVFNYKPLTVEGRAYMSEEMFAAFTNGLVNIEKHPSEYKHGMSILHSERNDIYRLPGNSFHTGGNVYVFDGFGMELPLIPEKEAAKYANILNEVAASLDENIDVYNIVVPTAAEFYAPLSHYPNHLYGIQKVYENLSERIIPVNIYDTLSQHANEHLFFKTDHHWTQRGAYYAYKEFMSYKNVDVPDINTFTNVPSTTFVGSYATFAKGTTAGNIIRQNPELLERFVPKFAERGTVYSSPDMTTPTTTYKAVSTTNNTYSAFIGGDNPIIVYDTTAASDRTLVIIKESYGNVFATWALNDFKRVCVIDPRRFNGFGGNNTQLNLNEFCASVGATDVMFINYPIAVISSPIRNSILKMK